MHDAGFRSILERMYSEPISRDGIVVPVTVDRHGLDGPTPAQARGPRWRRVAHGFYVPAEVDAGGLHQRIVEAAITLPLRGAVTGWGALAWSGTRWFNGLASDGSTPLPVPLAVDDGRRLAPRRGILVTEDWLFQDDVVCEDGLRITVPSRSVSFESRRARSLIDATRPIDMACAADAVDLAGLRTYAALLSGRPGIRLFRRALAAAEENVWSPMETTLRLVWRTAGHRGPLLCNPPVFDQTGQHLFTPDVFDPEAAVAGEYDGPTHLEDEARGRDLDREALYRDHGIELVTMVRTDLRNHHRFLGRLASAYRRGGRHRSWTLEQPPSWVDTSTVAKRRALTDAERARWLRWQRQ